VGVGGERCLREGDQQCQGDGTAYQVFTIEEIKNRHGRGTTASRSETFTKEHGRRRKRLWGPLQQSWRGKHTNGGKLGELDWKGTRKRSHPKRESGFETAASGKGLHQGERRKRKLLRFSETLNGTQRATTGEILEQVSEIGQTDNDKNQTTHLNHLTKHI